MEFLFLLQIKKEKKRLRTMPKYTKKKNKIYSVYKPPWNFKKFLQLKTM